MDIDRTWLSNYVEQRIHKKARRKYYDEIKYCYCASIVVVLLFVYKAQLQKEKKAIMDMIELSIWKNPGQT